MYQGFGVIIILLAEDFNVFQLNYIKMIIKKSISDVKWGKMKIAEYLNSLFSIKFLQI